MSTTKKTTTKKRNVRERDKTHGRFVPTGTDKAQPKETSISKLDRPLKYKKRQPVEPPVEPVVEGEIEPAPGV
ncbi:MAG: hypothetical protein M3367_03130 [Acidobacteriota bacterium]|nr:hypothetical protein [Acidobacteriota bacterium]